MTSAHMGDLTQAAGSEFQPLHEALRATPLGVVLADFSGRLVFANQAFCSMLSFSEEEIRHRSWTELSPAEDAGKEQCLFAQLRAGSTYHFHSEKRCFRRDGSLAVAHWSVWSLGNRATPFVLAMITEQGQEALAQRETEEHFRYLADTVPAMIWSSGVDGLSSYNNRRWLEFTGRSQEEQVGTGWADAIHPEDRQRCMEGYKHAFDRRESFQMEYRLRRYDGAYRWILGMGVPRFNSDGSFAGYLGSATDVTELRQAMATLRESEDRFRRVANMAPVMIFMSDPAGLCTYLNQPWLEFTGRSLNAELGNGWRERVDPDDLERCWKIYTKASDGREPFRMEYQLRRHDGEYRWILVDGVPRFSSDGSFAGYIGSAIDVTERKLAEEALSAASRKLIEAHEEERTRIARELHDEVNQRLGLLVITLEGLKRNPPASPNELRQKLGAIQEEVDNLSSDVQALSHRLHSSKLEILGLAAATTSFCREFADRQGVEIDLQAENVPQDVPPEISLCLFRVLQEALQNAAKHSGSRQFQVRLSCVADEIELTVHDDGIGFKPEEAIRGRGIGLASMKERLKLVAGELSIESRPQFGTTIHALVPLAPKTKSASA